MFSLLDCPIRQKTLNSCNIACIGEWGAIKSAFQRGDGGLHDNTSFPSFLVSCSITVHPSSENADLGQQQIPFVDIIGHKFAAPQPHSLTKCVYFTEPVNDYPCFLFFSVCRLTVEKGDHIITHCYIQGKDEYVGKTDTDCLPLSAVDLRHTNRRLHPRFVWPAPARADDLVDLAMLSARPLLDLTSSADRSANYRRRDSERILLNNVVYLDAELATALRERVPPELGVRARL